MRTSCVQVSSRSGYSLVEMILAVSLLGIVSATVATVTLNGSEAYRTTTVGSILVDNGRRTLDTISKEFSASRADSLGALPEDPLWQDFADFEQVTAISSDGALTFSDNRVQFRIDNGEVDDGIDNDGDGLVDEGVVELITDWGGADERTRVLCRWVRRYLEGEIANGIDDNGNGMIDEPGFVISRSGTVVNFILTLERSDSQGRLTAETLQTGAWPRN